MSFFVGPCTVCGGKDFVENEVLWPDLINAWQLSELEVSYINRQQGFNCNACHNNLRSMALSSAILREVGFDGLLNDFCESSTEISILEINTAGNLTGFLRNINRHKIVEYPEFDMQNLAIETGGFDLVIHSDTLEHVPNPERALSECFRVLKNDGRCIFTVPIIVDRMTRVCAGLVASYHGQSGILADDQLVITEFGVDIWKTVLRSGFRSCEIFALEYPSALAIIARK